MELNPLVAQGFSVAKIANGPSETDMRRDPRVLRFLEQARSESTQRAYRRFVTIYLDFCAETGRTPLPGTAATLEAFAAWLAERPVAKGRNKGKTGMAPASIQLALSAVRALHHAHDQDAPSTRLVKVVVEGHARERAGDPSIQDGMQAPAIRLPTLEDLVAACDHVTNAGMRDRAMLTLGIAMMARRSELAILDIGHVRDVDAGLEVFLRKSKTDQVGKGRVVKVPFFTALPELCPVRNLRAWRDRLAQLGIAEGPLFRAVDRHDNVHGTKAWAGKAERSLRMDPQTVERVIARAALKAALPNASRYKGHSLRAGGATMAREYGADVLFIARQGGWSERSPVVFRYIRDVDEWERNPMRGIGMPRD
jgi:integrase